MRWKCICAYDGTDFEGWQRQPNGNAVQNHIEAILSKIFSTKIQIHGSGRTDAGAPAWAGGAAQTCRSWSRQYGSRRVRFRIFPEPVRGISSMNSTERGIL